MTRTQIIIVHGGVERGDQRGRTIGFPTANLAVENTPVMDGVWAGWVQRGADVHVAAVSVGTRPTFYGRAGFRLLEAHLLDFDEDIYDELVTVTLVRRLRGIVRFGGVDELVAQLHDDVAATRAWAMTAAPPPVHLATAAAQAPLGRAILTA
jgi:riboflavin kinase/FMN adenylyltransferase